MMGRLTGMEMTVTSFGQELLRRRVPHAIVGYGGASLGILYFIQYVVEAFVLSPHWNRLAIVTLALLLPSVILVAYFHGAPGRDRWGLPEKIGVPLNLVLAGVVLFAVFGGTDLGAATTTVTVEDEEGTLIQRVVAKAEFRKSVALFPPDLREGLEEDDAWMSFVVSYGIFVDLLQDDFVQALPPEVFQERLWAAGHEDLRDVPLSLKLELAGQRFAEHVVDGELARIPGGVRLTVRQHETASGRLVSDASYEGQDLLALVDSATVAIRNGLKVPMRADVSDLPVAERLTHDPEALEFFGRAILAMGTQLDFGAATQGLFAATAADPTFALAQHALANLLFQNNRPAEAVAPIQAALDNVHQLPERVQFLVRSDYYFHNQEFDRALAVVEMWAELYPADPIALNNLMVIQQGRGDREGMLETALTLYEMTPGDGDLLRGIAGLQEDLGDLDGALATLEEYTRQFPEDYAGYNSLAGHYLVRGDLQGARRSLDRAILLEPGRTGLIANLASLDLRIGNFAEAKAGFDRAIELAASPQEEASAWSAIETYYYVRGEMDDGIETVGRRLELMATYAPPYAVAPTSTDIIIYFGAGRDGEVKAIVDDLASQLQAPLDVFGWLPRIQIAVEEGNPDEAASLIEMARERFTLLGIAGQNESQFLTWEGAVAELRQDWPAALEAYQARLPLLQGNAVATATAQRLVGRVLQRMGRLQDAEAATRETLRLWPSSSWAHLQLAEILEAGGARAEAIQHLERAMVGWPNASAAYEPPRRAREMLEELRR